jgi:uncharacterized protein (DUF983 family)
MIWHDLAVLQLKSYRAYLIYTYICRCNNLFGLFHKKKSPCSFVRLPVAIVLELNHFVCQVVRAREWALCMVWLTFTCITCVSLHHVGGL